MGLSARLALLMVFGVTARFTARPGCTARRTLRGMSSLEKKPISPCLLRVPPAGGGAVAPGEQISGLEDEYELSAGLPRLIYVKSPAPDREPRLAAMLARIEDEGSLSYQHFSDPGGLQQLVENDLAVLL